MSGLECRAPVLRRYLLMGVLSVVAALLPGIAQASPHSHGTCAKTQMGTTVVVHDVSLTCAQTPEGFQWRPTSTVTSGESQGSGSSGAGSTRPPKADASVLLRTVPVGQDNTVFQYWQLYYPEAAQWVKFPHAAAVSSVSFAPEEANNALPGWWESRGQRPDLLGMLKGGARIPATVTATLWRSDSQQVVPATFDLSTGFTQVARKVSTAPLILGQEYTVPFDAAVHVTAGPYVIVIGFAFTDPNLIDIRIAGRQSGNNTNGGFNHDLPKTCTYTPSADVYPQGAAFRGLGAGLASLPYPPSPGDSVGVGTAFIRNEAKVRECFVAGEYTNPWNPGDLALTFRQPTGAMSGSDSGMGPAGTALSKKAALPRAAYAGLACDPFDRRLRNIPLPNGAGPEARVAAACIMLDWLSRANAPTAPISVYRSPGVPTSSETTARTSIAAGDRLFGQYGSSGRSYEMLVATNPAWSCAKGASLVDPRSVGLGTQAVPWARNESTGCPGAPYRSGGGGGAMILTQSGDVYFSWSVSQGDDARTALSTNGPMSGGFYTLTHEYAHAIQWQRAAAHSPVPLTSFGQIETPGTWFHEGQAQYLGFMVSQLTGPDRRCFTGRPIPKASKHRCPSTQVIGGAANSFSSPLARTDLRRYELTQLKTVIQRNNIGGNVLEATRVVRDFDLPYAAGYFAYEYLLAHYGPTATWDMWNLWNSTPCASTGQGTCWRDHAQQAFGMSADDILSRLDTYVVAQLSG